MLYYALLFFVIALVAAAFGFGGIAAGAVGIAKILFLASLPCLSSRCLQGCGADAGLA